MLLHSSSEKLQVAHEYSPFILLIAGSGSLVVAQVYCTNIPNHRNMLIYQSTELE